MSWLLTVHRGLSRQRLLLGVLIGVAVLGGGVPTASAQSLERLEEELQRTDEKLDWARSIVAEGHSQRARETLERAFRTQEAAWDNFRNERPLVSWKLTQEARRLGLRAVTLAREDGGLRNRARRELDRAHDALRRVVEELGASPPESAQRLLEEAREQLGRGERLFGEQRYEASLRLAISAQRLARQAAGLGGGAGEGGRVLRELERTDQLIDRAAPVVHENPHEEATRMLDQAIEHQGAAWEAFRAGRPRPALTRTRKARELVNRALSLVRGPVSEEQVVKELDATDRVLERAAGVVEDPGNVAARRLLDTAREHQGRARVQFGEERYRAALAQTLVGRRLARRAVRVARGEEGA